MPEENNRTVNDWCRYALALEASEEGLWDWDLVTGQLWTSQRFQSITGLNESCSTLEAWIERVHPLDRPRLTAQLHALRDGKEPRLSGEHRVRAGDGAWSWIEFRSLVARDATGRITHVAGSLRDNTGHRMADPLTGLPNRASFVDRLERRIERGFEHADWNFALLAITLDRFDRLNETFGSSGGERLLIETAAHLQSLLPDSSIAARLIGAEFMILLEGAHSASAAVHFATRAIESFRKPLVLRGKTRTHTVVPQLAIGVAQASMLCSHPEEIMAEAESALLHACRQQRPGVACFAQGMREHALELVADRLELETELERAIRQSELVLFYQPEVELRTNRIIGFEALVRWQHPQRGLIPPGDFIPLAEETGLIVPLGEWGLVEACRQLVQWRKSSVEQLRNARISVNLSAKQLEQPSLVPLVQRTLADTRLNPACLRLEITECTLISDAPAAHKNMRELETLGVGLHMDDFGTGYSSLDYLQRFPFDTLKIDRSFVRGIAHDRESRLIVGSIISLARSFGMDVVAEGIEDAEQLEELKTMGCPCGQGFYFAKPMDPAAIDALILTGAWGYMSGAPQLPIAQA